MSESRNKLPRLPLTSAAIALGLTLLGGSSSGQSVEQASGPSKHIGPVVEGQPFVIDASYGSSVVTEVTFYDPKGHYSQEKGTKIGKLVSDITIVTGTCYVNGVAPKLPNGATSSSVWIKVQLDPGQPYFGLDKSQQYAPEGGLPALIPATYTSSRHPGILPACEEPLTAFN